MIDTDHPLRHYREKQGLSLDQLGARLRVSAATISRIEHRKQGVTLDLALRIEAETNSAVKPADLLIETAA